MSVLSESPVPENGTPGSMRGMWRRGYGLAHRAPPNERGGNSDATAYGYRATSLLYSLKAKWLIFMELTSKRSITDWCSCRLRRVF